MVPLFPAAKSHKHVANSVLGLSSSFDSKLKIEQKKLDILPVDAHIDRAK